MRKLFLALFALLSIQSFGTYGNNNNGGGQLVVDAYMDVNSADCYDTTHNVVELANHYARNRQVQVNLHLVNQNQNDIVRFRRNVAFRADRNVRVRFVRNVGARRVVVVNNRFVGNRVVVRRGRQVFFNQAFFGGFGRGQRAVVINRVRF